MLLTKNTHDIQSGLASYCRTNTPVNLPGITPGRVHHYRRLVYNIIDDTFSGAFPITRSFLTDDEWDFLVDRFFSNHPCSTPSIWRLPKEFYEYVQQHPSVLNEKYPFLTDLLYFEWLEIEIHTMPDEPALPYREKGDLINDELVLNPEFRLVQLEYPVHCTKPADLLKHTKPSINFVLIFRHPETGNVEFFDLSALYAILITQLHETQKPVSTLLDSICPLFNLEHNLAVSNEVEVFVNELMNKKFIRGFAA